MQLPQLTGGEGSSEATSSPLQGISSPSLSQPKDAQGAESDSSEYRTVSAAAPAFRASFAWMILLLSACTALLVFELVRPRIAQ